jgi:hypothetical protein
MGVYKPKTIYYIIHITKNENRKKFFIYNYKERMIMLFMNTTTNPTNNNPEVLQD